MKVLGWMGLILLVILFVYFIRSIPKSMQVVRENAKRIDAAHTRDYQKLAGSWGNGNYAGMMPIGFGIMSFAIVICIITLLGWLL